MREKLQSDDSDAAADRQTERRSCVILIHASTFTLIASSLQVILGKYTTFDFVMFHRNVIARSASEAALASHAWINVN